jgi:signal recognition particle receptor subunit beta
VGAVVPRTAGQLTVHVPDTGVTLDEVRWALDANDRVPVIVFGARERGSVRDALLVVLEQALARTGT